MLSDEQRSDFAWRPRGRVIADGTDFPAWTIRNGVEVFVGVRP
jgi:hypothetical protein